ncbi:hypothetical protein [uncultured Clostridium sp.]|uniref:hypothetical protein n=1 Tax=uncultured Clostridium sp. TaxID=59620 RepID=UPI0025E96144|nr:hypothetical protein [uncultured Clostridium sp.]
MRYHIKIPKRKSFVVNILIAYVCCMWFAISMLHLPSMITYGTDLLLVIGLVFSFGNFQREIYKANVKPLIMIMLIIFIATFWGAFLNGVSPVMYLWGFRNNGRFYLFFLVCIVMLKERHLAGIVKMLKFFFWVNVLVCTYQYFVLHLFGDRVGGLFGILQGGNSYLNIFLAIIWTISLGEYIEKKIKLKNLGIKATFCIYMAALAEIKMFYVEMIIVVCISIFIVKPSLKTLGLILCGVIGGVIAIKVMMVVSPDSIITLFDADARQVYLSGNGYTNTGDLNRFTALSSIHEMFFQGKPLKELLGFGLGNCDTSTFSFLQSAFYKQYEYLHYRWFSHAWIYLEQGFVGILGVLSFFIGIIIILIKNRKKIIKKEVLIASILFVSVCIINLIYNNSLQTEAGYLSAIICAIPFVSIKETKGVRKQRIE